MSTRALIVVVLTLAACGKVTTGPFIPPHAQACSYDGDCPTHTTCKFPRADSHAVCMPGDNSLDKTPTF